MDERATKQQDRMGGPERECKLTLTCFMPSWLLSFLFSSTGEAAGVVCALPPRANQRNNRLAIQAGFPSDPGR